VSGKSSTVLPESVEAVRIDSTGELCHSGIVQSLIADTAGAAVVPLQPIRGFESRSTCLRLEPADR
jgi:hypothetical protein